MWLKQIASALDPALNIVYEYSRLATSRQSYHDDGDATRMEQPARHGAVQLGRSPVHAILARVVDAIDEGAAFPSVLLSLVL